MAVQVEELNPPNERIVNGRTDVGVVAARCKAYAIFSELLASPFDIEVDERAGTERFEELSLPYELEALPALIEEWQGAEITALKRDYSGLFEVGDDGPPTPIREDVFLEQPAGVREDIVRFYDFFNYALSDNFAWAPDHLSVQLEFMHFLCYYETQQEGDVLSYQLAQFDFAERHLFTWVPQLAEAVRQLQPDALYSRLIHLLSEFVAKDLEWQSGTISESEV
ncbi:MAG: TorD/DmsD family molecular chaperone [Gammaproteobacteria bacterium]